jgi:hypothetical protein
MARIPISIEQSADDFEQCLAQLDLVIGAK